MEGQSSDCPGRAFTAVRTIQAPKRLRGDLRENGDESGYFPYPEGVYSHKKEISILLL